MNINLEKWKSFIEENQELSIECGIKHDLNSFSCELDENNWSLDWRLFPLEEMVSRKWIASTKKELRSKPKQVFERFIDFIGEEEIPQAVLFRKTFHKNTKKLMNDYALLAWSIRVVSKAFKDESIKKYNSNMISKDWLHEVVQLSKYKDGPIKAKELLAENGIALVIEKSLPGAIFNGAAIPTRKEMPVIGMTLHYDRVDNFWFTLLHELAHVWKHFDDVNELYIDYFSSEQDDDDKEDEANAIAREALIPKSNLMHDAFLLKTDVAVEELAEKLNINTAIIAGRIQFDLKQYNILRKYVDVPVRHLFKDVSWT